MEFWLGMLLLIHTYLFFLTQQNKALKILARVANDYNSQSLHKSEKNPFNEQDLGLETAKFK